MRPNTVSSREAAKRAAPLEGTISLGGTYTGRPLTAYRVPYTADRTPLTADG